MLVLVEPLRVKEPASTPEYPLECPQYPRVPPRVPSVPPSTPEYSRCPSSSSPCVKKSLRGSAHCEYPRGTPTCCDVPTSTHLECSLWRCGTHAARGAPISPCRWGRGRDEGQGGGGRGNLDGSMPCLIASFSSRASENVWCTCGARTPPPTRPPGLGCARHGAFASGMFPREERAKSPPRTQSVGTAETQREGITQHTNQSSSGPPHMDNQTRG